MILTGCGKSRYEGKKHTSGAEARTNLNDLTARLKSCPSQNPRESCVSPQAAREEISSIRFLQLLTAARALPESTRTLRLQRPPCLYLDVIDQKKNKSEKGTDDKGK